MQEGDAGRVSPPGCHQATLSAICSIRGSPSVAVIFPKFELVIPVTGFARCVALKTLNASKRYSMRLASPSFGSDHPFERERSVFAYPGPHNAFRPSVPKVLGAGLANLVTSK